MVLSAPFPLTDRAQWGAAGQSKPPAWSDSSIFESLQSYRCDGFVIRDMQMRGILHKDDTLEVEVKGNFDSHKGHDKRVDMMIEFLNGTTVAATAYAHKLKAPEDKVKHFGFTITIPAAAVQSDPPTHPCVTVTDYDD